MMLRAFVFAVTAFAVGGAPAAARDRTATAKHCHAIAVTLLDTVDSRRTAPGTPFRFKTTFRTQFGPTVVPAGTHGYGIVRAISAAGRQGRDGSVTLEPRYIQSRDARLTVTMNPALPLAWTRTNVVTEGLLHAPVPLIPGLAVGLIGFAVWGRNIVLARGFTFSVVPLGDLHGHPAC